LASAVAGEEHIVEFGEVVAERFAAREFKRRSIPESKMRRLIEVVRLSPSDLNLQPWKLTVISKKDIKLQLLDATWNQQQTTTCSHLLVFCANCDLAGLIEKLDRLNREAGMTDEARKFVRDVALDMTKQMSSEQILHWAQCNVYLALANALNGAKSLGLDSCPMTGFDPKQYAQILSVPGYLVPTALCALGYAADAPTRKLRFQTSDIVF
jgi:nitroreductase / dihydropteridine reductase